jgi:hypothetical protein
MRIINSVADLKDAISELEFNKAVHRRMLKDSFNDTLETLKPGNILKNISQAIVNPSLLSNILPAVVGLGTGFISNKIVGKIAAGAFGGSRFRRIFMSVALYGITKALTKNPRINRIFGRGIVNSVFNR